MPRIDRLFRRLFRPINDNSSTSFQQVSHLVETAKKDKPAIFDCQSTIFSNNKPAQELWAGWMPSRGKIRC
jgi:hypothetical protein